MRKGPAFAFMATALVLLLFLSALRNRPKDPTFEGKLASEWCRELLSEDYAERDNARTALTTLGERSVPQLRSLLGRRNGPWEEPLLWLSGAFGFFDYQRLDANVCRIAASEVLGMLGPKAEGAASDLVSALAYDASAADSERALVRIGTHSIPHLERALKAKSASVRSRSARLLREIPSLQDSIIYSLIKVTSDPIAAVRREAASSLGAKLPVQSLSESTRLAISESLLAAARDRDFEVRAAAMRALGNSVAAQRSVIDALHVGLEDQFPGVTLEAARSMWRLNQPASEIVPPLIAILRTGERWRAAYALGEMGTNAAPAVDALTELLENERVPRPFRTPPSSAFALGRIGTTAVPVVAELLKSSEAGVRMNALMAIGFMGEAGRGAVPQLMKLLSDKDSEVRHTAALTLASVGADPDQIIPGLSDCLQAEDIYMRSAAAAHLRHIAPHQTWLIPGE